MLKINREKLLGCILGGAIGDALGAPIEFLSIDQIRRYNGENGISGYVEFTDGKGRITDDTQMTLFTLEGLLAARKFADEDNIEGMEIEFVYQSYLHWLLTQGEPLPDSVSKKYPTLISERLQKERWLYVRRAPGFTCISALKSGACGTIAHPLNDSKGCGGVMRIAPVGLLFHDDLEVTFRLGCEVAAITHGHPSGYLSAGCLATIIAELMNGKSLTESVGNSITILNKWPNHAECLQIMERAVELAESLPATSENIARLGEGWVGEEALAIAVFCSLKHQDDFRAGVLAAVNHSGDSDSTGAIAGNILGASLGLSAIPTIWIENLNEGKMIKKVIKEFGLFREAVRY